MPSLWRNSGRKIEMNLVVNDRSIIDLMLLSRASRYDLSDKAERRRSNKELVDFFYLLQQRLRPAIKPARTSVMPST